MQLPEVLAYLRQQARAAIAGDLCKAQLLMQVLQLRAQGPPLAFQQGRRQQFWQALRLGRGALFGEEGQQLALADQAQRVEPRQPGATLDNGAGALLQGAQLGRGQGAEARRQVGLVSSGVALFQLLSQCLQGLDQPVAFCGLAVAATKQREPACQPLATLIVQAQQAVQVLVEPGAVGRRVVDFEVGRVRLQGFQALFLAAQQALEALVERLHRGGVGGEWLELGQGCLLYTSPSPRD